MSIRRIRFTDDPVKMSRTAEDKLKKYGTTREDGEKYFDQIYSANREKYKAFINGTATEAEEPTDMLYADLTALPPIIEIEGGGSYYGNNKSLGASCYNQKLLLQNHF